MTFSADQDLGAFFNAFADVGFHSLILFLRHHWPNGNLGISRVADRKSGHLIPYGSLHFVEPALGHEKPRSCGASLTTVHKCQDKSRWDGLIERSVIQQDCGRLSTEF